MYLDIWWCSSNRFRPRRPASTEANQLCRRYYSTLVHSLFPHSHDPMGRLSDTTGERLRPQLPNSELLLNVSLIRKTQQHFSGRLESRNQELMISRRTRQPLDQRGSCWHICELTVIWSVKRFKIFGYNYCLQRTWND